MVVAVQAWPDHAGGGASASQTAQAVASAWTGATPHADVAACAVGDGGPRSADSMPGEPRPVGGAMSIAAGSVEVLAPAATDARWNPHGLSTALLGIAARAAAAGERATVVIPVGDEPPAGDATDLWGGGLEAFRAALAPLTVIVLVSASRPLVGFHGMSSALRDGREKDAAIGAAAQAQEARWSEIAQHADAVAGRPGLIGPARLSDVRGSGAAGGLAYCLAAAGARLTPASAYLFDLSGAAQASTQADVLVAVTSTLTPPALDHGLMVPVSAAAAARAVPCLAIAPGVQVGKRDLMAAGVASAYEAGMGLDALTAQVARVAHTWTPSR